MDSKDFNYSSIEEWLEHFFGPNRSKEDALKVGQQLTFDDIDAILEEEGHEPRP